MNEAEDKDLLGRLAGAPVGLSTTEELQAARERHLGWLGDAVQELPLRVARERARRRKRRFGKGIGLAALVAAAALAVLFLSPQRLLPQSFGGSSESAEQDKSATSPAYATLVSGELKSGELQLLAGSRLGLRSRLATGPEQGARVLASQGFELLLKNESELSFVPGKGSGGESTELQLHAGKVQLSVPPLAQGSSLSVLTEDARVTVIGTKFSVAKQASGITCVEVNEGKVLVERHEQRRILPAGTSWGCDALETQHQSASQKHGASGEESEKAPEPAAHKVPWQNAQKVRTETSLEQENLLLARALSAERQGERKKARQAYQELLTRFPQSSFAVDARAGLLRMSANK